MRSERAHELVLHAATQLFAAQGVDATSMDAIAASSGVSKATIYKHWPDKGALCLDVIRALTPSSEEPRLKGDLRRDLIAALQRRPHNPDAALRGRLMPHLVAYAARDHSVAQACRASVFGPARAQVLAILERAVKARELPRSLDLDLACALLLGPGLYAHLQTRLGAREPPRLAEQVVDAFLRAHALGFTQDELLRERAADGRRDQQGRERRRHAPRA